MDHRGQSFVVYFRGQNSGQCLTSSLRTQTLNRCTSASLQMIKSGGAPYIYQRVMLKNSMNIHNRLKK